MAKAVTIAPAGATTVMPAQPVTTPGPVSSTPGAFPGALAAVSVKSDPDGAEIELDGAFVGSTPATLQIAPGPHDIGVKKGAATWKRTVQVQPGSTITLNATLTSNPPNKATRQAK